MNKLNQIMIDLMRGCLIVLVIVLVGLGAFLGYSFVASPYVEVTIRMVVIGFGALAGLILASIITGVCFLLLNINDNLEKLTKES
ncbi:hypothetical protein ABMX64_19935 [Vibrio vulnificus]|uniref:hypothetical protein n=1 Tax=Vibrio vulnificus TaxID=672 RepID=UPI0024DF5510|nr:hypothetical protein [Vibrio vulnificus]MDK2679276.1 hypothetical protein [Vibrio vulnificus]MDK2688048.1 hypothetical protein [Vibrio vulnificus]